MKVSELQDIRAVQAIVAVVRPSLGGTAGQFWAPGTELLLGAAEGDRDPFVCAGERTEVINPATPETVRNLRRLLTSQQPRICWIAGRTDKDVVLHVFQAYQRFAADCSFAIGIDEMTLEQIRRSSGGKRVSTIADGCSWLASRLLIEPSSLKSTWRCLVTAGKEDTSTGVPAFTIHGRRLTIDVVRQTGGELLVTRVAPARRNNDLPVHLFEGPIQFVDRTVRATLEQQDAALALDRLVRDGGGYFDVWDQYNKWEREAAERSARSFGHVSYSDASQIDDGVWRFEIADGTADPELLQRLRGIDEELEASEALPDYLLARQAEGRARPANQFVGEVIETNQFNGTVTVRGRRDPDEPVVPPAQGFLFVSLRGDAKRLQRRDDARRRIASRTCPLGQLRELIDGGMVPTRRRVPIEPLTPAVRRLFGGQPTARQVEALRVALNTPDIAVIQGPPGTGKTKVIEALQVLLSDAANATDGRRHRILLTSYQHEAVENAVGRTNVFGLPAIKIGVKRGSVQDDTPFERWAKERAEELRARIGHLGYMPAALALQTVQSEAANYFAAPGDSESTRALLRRILDAARHWLSPELLDQLAALRAKLGIVPELEDANDEGLRAALSAIRGLRCEPEAFLDDGPVAAGKVFIRLEALGVLDDESRALLQSALAWSEDSPPPFLSSLHSFRERLAEDVSSRLSRRRPGVNEAVQTIIGQVVAALEAAVRSSADGELGVLWGYLTDLETDPEGVAEAIREYAEIVAATCQHSASRAMAEFLGTESEFDTVIVDEASRANPLDLMIPMALAGDRIVLVGDHRQLPHLLEPNVELEVAASHAEAAGTALKESLFQRLFLGMQERERTDDVVRTVTLDVQFRMHTILGDFVSSTFYPAGEGFTSGVDDSKLSHGLSQFGTAVAAWVDIPRNRGGELPGKSKARSAEAAWIGSHLVELMQERPRLSFGVIAFYSQQVLEIQRALLDAGVYERNEAGLLELAESYRIGRDEHDRYHDRLRVGTVDSFQGREFDVVILSVTRSNPHPRSTVMEQRRKYGHLLLSNRLCVAMSRQKRLLITVGDAEMFEGPEAAECVKGLSGFLTLCRTSSGVVIHG